MFHCKRPPAPSAVGEVLTSFTLKVPILQSIHNPPQVHQCCGKVLYTEFKEEPVFEWAAANPHLTARYRWKWNPLIWLAVDCTVQSYHKVHLCVLELLVVSHDLPQTTRKEEEILKCKHLQIEDRLIRPKAPEELLNGPWGKIVCQLLFLPLMNFLNESTYNDTFYISHYFRSAADCQQVNGGFIIH